MVQFYLTGSEWKQQLDKCVETEKKAKEEITAKLGKSQNLWVFSSDLVTTKLTNGFLIEFQARGLRFSSCDINLE